MATRVLDIAVCGRDSAANEIASVLTSTTSQLLDSLEHGHVRVNRLHETTPDKAVAAGHHLVVVVNDIESAWSDVGITASIEAETVARDRLVPWVKRWQEGRRAPRAQTAVLIAPDPSWSSEAARLIARLRASTHDESVLRIDHIGSTSVSGLPAKNLIDIQLSVPNSDGSVAVARAAMRQGLST